MVAEEKAGETAPVAATGSLVPLPARFFYFTRGLWNLLSLGLALTLKAFADASVPPWAYGLLGAVVLAAQGWRVWGAGYIGRPARGGTPAGEALIAAGPYAYLRNPMYLGTFLTMLAFSSMSGLWYAVLAVAAILAVVYTSSIAYEEAFLSARFGEEYRRYREAVPRFLPSLRALAGRRARPPAQGRFRLADGLLNESGSLILLPLFFSLFWFVD